MDYLLVKITRANAPEPDENDIDIHEEDDCDVHDGLDCAMSDYAESMEIEFEAEQETEIVKCLENDKKAQEADEEHLTKADEEEELIVQTQAVEEPELKEYQYEEEEEERDLSQEHMSVNYAELEIELPCADAPADIADGDVEKETQEAVSKDVAVEEVVTTCVQPEEQADQKDQRLGQFVEERSDTKPLGDRGDSMETLVEIEGPIDSAPMNVIETLIADERVEDKEPDVIQDNKTSHLPSVHLRYDFGNTSCGPSAMYKDEESPDMDEEEPQADAASSVTPPLYSCKETRLMPRCK